MLEHQEQICVQLVSVMSPLVLGFWIIPLLPPQLSRLGESKAKILLRGRGLLSSAGASLIRSCQNCLEEWPAAHVHWGSLALGNLTMPDTPPSAQNRLPGSSRTHLLPDQCGWGNVNSTFSFPGKMDSGDILPASSAGSWWQALICLVTRVTFRFGWCIAFCLGENASCQGA